VTAPDPVQYLPAVPQPSGGPPSCDLCGVASPSGYPPLTWVCTVEQGTRVWHCDRCARENLRSIEAGLDSTWW